MLINTHPASAPSTSLANVTSESGCGTFVNMYLEPRFDRLSERHLRAGMRNIDQHAPGIRASTGSANVASESGCEMLINTYLEPRFDKLGERHVRIRMRNTRRLLAGQIGQRHGSRAGDR